MLTYDGTLNIRKDKESSALLPAKKHLTELEKERRVILTDVSPLGEAGVLEYWAIEYPFTIMYSIGASFFRELASGQIFALVFVDKDNHGSLNLNQHYQLQREHKTPAVWQGTRDTQIYIIPVLQTKETVVDVKECDNLPKNLKKLCVQGILFNVNVLGNALINNLIYYGRHIDGRYGVGLLLFSCNGTLYAKTELIDQRSCENPLIKKTLVAKLRQSMRD